MYQLTEDDFEIFKEEACKWIDFFGLKDWVVYYSFEHLDDCRAQCMANWSAKACSLTLGKFPERELTENEIRRHAFHEVCELLVSDFEFMALNEDVPLEERKRLTEVARHGLIRRLENSVFARA